MPDDFFFHVKIATSAGVVVAVTVAILCFTPILDTRFCFMPTCTPMQATQNDCPDKGADCESCGQGGEGGSVTTMIDDHSVNKGHSIKIETINIYEGRDWCPLPPSGETAPPDGSSPDGTPSGGKQPSDGAATSDEGKEDEESGCAAGSSGVKRKLGEVHFAYDSDNFRDPDGPSKENKKILDKVVVEINGWPEGQPREIISLEAYASHPGPVIYNLDLAERRIQSVAGHIGANVVGAVWTFRQVIHGESHIYRSRSKDRSTGATSDREDHRNRVVRIFACSAPCCDMEQEAVSNPDP